MSDRTTRSGKRRRAFEELSNQEIVTLAVFLAGGASAPVDTEDAAVKASQLAPGRFGWRKYKDQINIETVRKRLWDARRMARLTGSERTGWALTEQGLRFAKTVLPTVSRQPSLRGRLTLKEKQWLAAERRRLLASEAFQHFRRNGEEGVRLREAEAFFRLDDYIVGDQRERKILRIVNAFGDDSRLGGAVARLAVMVRRRDDR